MKKFIEKIVNPLDVASTLNQYYLSMANDGYELIDYNMLLLPYKTPTILLVMTFEE